MKFPSNKSKNVQKYISALMENGIIAFSNKLGDRIAVSGDLSGSSFHHHQWKRKFIADLVIWPKSVSQIQFIVELAEKLNLSLTVRGGGCNYFGSTHPFNGGIILDLKRMNQFHFNLEAKTMTVEAGSVISTVMDYLNRHSFQLCVYPTSSLSATFAGWLSTGGSIGIGSSSYGEFLSQIEKLAVISPTGKIIEVSTKEEISLYVGSLGLFGIITSITFRVVPQFSLFPYYLQVESLTTLNSTLSKIAELEDVYFCFFSNFGLHSLRNLHEVQSGNVPFYILLVTRTLLNSADEFFDQAEITHYSKILAQEVWQNRFKFELAPKRGNTVLISQHYKVSIELLIQVLKKANFKFKKAQIRSFYSGIVVSPEQIRLSISIPSTGDLFDHLLPSKAILHSLTNYIYQNNGCLYTLGLLNFIYGQKFESSQLKLLKKRKKALDPSSRLNPGKLTYGTATYFRMQILFGLNSFWRRHLRGGRKSRERKCNLETKEIQSPGIFDLCSSCGFCRNKCPAYLVDPNEIYSPSGRFRLVSTMIEEKINPFPFEFIDSLFRCTTCQACEKICPLEIPIVNIVEYLRAKINSSSK
ncbi:FAD-binding protein [Candidatus Lokiarchaeum ossiferum]